MKTIDYLSAQITTSASVIQFAKDGKYEESWIINRDEDKPKTQEIKRYVDQDKYERLIVEFIWNPDDDSQRYVLTVILNEHCVVKDREEFISICLDILYEAADFATAIKELNERVVGKEFLFQVPVELVRLGIFNNWFSVGPIDLWNTGEELNKDEVIAKIKARPEVERSSLNYQGLAFIYNFSGKKSGPYHILKTPCCKKEGDEWVLVGELVWENLKKMIDIPVQ